MKLNFVKALKQDVPSNEIASEIVRLEEKRHELEDAKKKSYEVLKEMRGRELCGESVPAQDMRDAENAFNRAQLDLEVADDSIVKLEEKLRATLVSERDIKEAQAHKAEKELEKEKQRLLKEWARVKGQLYAIGLAIWGHPVDVRNQLSDSHVFVYENGDPCKRAFEYGCTSADAGIGYPTYSDRYHAEVTTPRHAVTWFDVEKEASRLKHESRERIMRGRKM